MRFALALALALGLAVISGAAQRIMTNGRNLQIPINHGLPDKPLGFTFCRLRYENIRRARTVSYTHLTLPTNREV